MTMSWPIVLITILAAVILFLRRNSGTPTPDKSPEQEPDAGNLNYAEAYQPSWLFSMNEKQFYRKLNEFALANGYTVFAKVRLLDLLEPRKNQKNYKAFLNKIKSKHVDFVLCDEKLVARHVIELDDNSHKQQDRKERDELVDTILRSCGYNIIHMQAFDETLLRQALNRAT